MANRMLNVSGKECIRIREEGDVGAGNLEREQEVRQRTPGLQNLKDRTN